LENDTLLRVLQSKTFRLVLVVTLKGFDLDIVAERFAKVLHPLDIELDI